MLPVSQRRRKRGTKQGGADRRPPLLKTLKFLVPFYLMKIVVPTGGKVTNSAPVPVIQTEVGMFTTAIGYLVAWAST